MKPFVWDLSGGKLLNKDLNQAVGLDIVMWITNHSFVYPSK